MYSGYNIHHGIGHIIQGIGVIPLISIGIGGFSRGSNDLSLTPARRHISRSCSYLCVSVSVCVCVFWMSDTKQVVQLGFITSWRRGAGGILTPFTLRNIFGRI